MPRLLTLALLLTIAPSLRAEDVPQFRGPGGLGLSSEKGLPVQWNAKDNLRWKKPLPGRGLSNPVISGERVFVTAASTYQEKRLHVLCFAIKDGSKVWERQLTATSSTQCNAKTTMAAPTPVTDGQRVFALFASFDLACFDRDGNLLWYRSLGGDYPTLGNYVGLAASPVLCGDTLIVCLDTASLSLALGIDAATGVNRWRIDRPRGINWVTPLVIRNGTRDEVLLQAPKELSAHDPATGKKLWSIADKTFATMPSPTFGEGVVFTAGEKFFAIKPGAGKEEAKVLWESGKLPTGYGSPVCHDGRVYTLNTRGVINCADAASGKALWDLRIEGEFAASPLLADGKLYAVSEEGMTSVVQLGDKAEIVATNPLEDKIMATPVASDRAIFLRSDGFLYCVGPK